MPTRLVQQERHAPGSAALQVAGPAQAQLPFPEEIEISIVQSGAVDRYLDPRDPDQPWKSAVFRFRPLASWRDAGVLSIELDHGITYHLKPNQPYRLVIRPDEGDEMEERFTGIGGMRRPAPKPVGWVPPAAPKGPMSAPVQEPEPAPVPAPEPAGVETDGPVDLLIDETAPVHVEEEQWPPPAPIVEEPIVDPIIPPPPPPPKPKSKLLPMVLGLVALLLIGGAVAWFMSQKDKTVTTAKTELDSVSAVRDFLVRDPQGAQALAQANALSQSGKLLDGQLLLYKYAGEHGEKEAARRMGSFYDPATWAADKSPMQAPNPVEAARWYKQAAEAGDAESQYRYAMLLKNGGTDAPDGPEQAVVWLRKAAELGHADAKKALGN